MAELCLHLQVGDTSDARTATSWIVGFPLPAVTLIFFDFVTNDEPSGFTNGGALPCQPTVHMLALLFTLDSRHLWSCHGCAIATLLGFDAGPLALVINTAEQLCGSRWRMAIFLYLCACVSVCVCRMC